MHESEKRPKGEETRKSFHLDTLLEVFLYFRYSQDARKEELAIQ